MTEEFNTQRDEKTDSRHNLTWHMMDINRQKREKQMHLPFFYAYHNDKEVFIYGIAITAFEQMLRCKAGC